jgi:hypothetical protein
MLEEKGNAGYTQTQGRDVKPIGLTSRQGRAGRVGRAHREPQLL